MLKHSSASIFPLVRDTVSEILDTLDLCRHDSKRLSSFLPVLLAIVKSTKEWFKLGQNCRKIPVRNDYVGDRSVQSDIKEFILEFHKNVKTATNLTENDEKDGNDEVNKKTENIQEDQFTNEESEAKTPAEIKVIEQVLKRCCHLVVNPSPKVRLVVMEIVVEGMESLSDEENTLLPLVHQLWSPLLSRFTDPELQVCRLIVSCNIKNIILEVPC